MGNTAIKAESEFGNKISRSCGDNVGRSPTLRTPKSSALPDTLASFEDAVSITTDSTSSTAEYESANENDAKRLSSGSDISCDFPMDTKASTISHLSSLSNDWATTSTDPTDQPVLPSQAVTIDKNHSVTSQDHRFVDSPNSVVQSQGVNIEELDRENQLFLRSRDHRTRSKVKRYEESRRRAPAAKKSGKHSRQVAVEQARKKHPLKRPVQRPPVVHNDFFIFSYDHVFKEAPADDILSSTCENRLQQISIALSDTITKVSQLLDNAEGRAPSLTLPHLMWTWLLNVRASHIPFFEFDVYNVHLFRGVGEPLSKLEAAEVRQFFAQPTYLDLLRKFEFCLKAYAPRLMYVVDTSKSVPDSGMLVATSVVDEYCCLSNVSKDCSHEMASASVKHLDAEYGAPEVALNDSVSPSRILEDSNSVIQSLKPVTDVNNEAVPSVEVADECIQNRLLQPRCVVKPLKSAPLVEIPVLSQEECPSVLNNETVVPNELISMADCDSNATSLELVDDRCCSLTAEETEEFDSCVESVDGGPASDGWSDICSLPSENSFAFPSLRSEILQCAFQVLGMPSENEKCSCGFQY